MIYLLLLGLIHLVPAGLVWSEEFDGTSLDTNTWIVANGNPGVNSEKENYTNREENLKVANGYLTITAKSEWYGGDAYTSGKVTTKRQFGPTGTLKIRARLPSGKGLWPALWNCGPHPWPSHGEEDTMEMKGDNPKVFYTTVHWGSSWRAQTSYGTVVTTDCDLSQDFHEWSFVRSSDKTMSFAFDNYTYAKWDYDTFHGQQAWYNQPFWTDAENIILNIAVGGDFLGSEQPYYGINWAKPTMEVDYIRYYDDQTHAPFAAGKSNAYNFNAKCGTSVAGPTPTVPANAPSPTPPPTKGGNSGGNNGDCAGNNVDPWATGSEKTCCSGLTKCLKKWDKWNIFAKKSYRCVSSCSGSSVEDALATEQTCTEYVKAQDMCIIGYNLSTNDKQTLDECTQLCNENDDCKSFDYRAASYGYNCAIQGVTSTESGSSYENCADAGWSHYERTCDGKTCTDIQCPEEACKAQICTKMSDDAFFYCLGGPSGNGCDTRATWWIDHIDACSSCCDTRTCAATQAEVEVEGALAVSNISEQQGHADWTLFLAGILFSVMVYGLVQIFKGKVMKTSSHYVSFIEQEQEI